MKDNPYAAPQANELLARGDISAGEALELRRQFRSTERLVRSIGLVYFMQATVVVLVLFILLTNPEENVTQALSAALYCLVLAIVLLIAGYGLRIMASWSRLMALFQTLFLLSGFMLGLYALTVDSRVGFTFAVLHALPFYILFSSRAAYVLSQRYADVMAITAGERPSAWLLALLIATLLATLLLLGTVPFSALRLS